MVSATGASPRVEQGSNMCIARESSQIVQGFKQVVVPMDGVGLAQKGYGLVCEQTDV